jgi:hypothetical protein
LVDPPQVLFLIELQLYARLVILSYSGFIIVFDPIVLLENVELWLHDKLFSEEKWLIFCGNVSASVFEFSLGI